MAATWWKTHGSLAMLRSWSRATDSICPGSAQASTSTLSPRMRCMGNRCVTFRTAWQLASAQRLADPLRVLLALAIRFVLGPRPEEAAQPVALAPGHDVHVQVRHALRDLRVHRDEAAVGPERRLHGAGDALHRGH